MAVPTVSWDETTPPGTEARSNGDNRMREMKTQAREILDVEHIVAASGTFSGKHKVPRGATLPTTELDNGNFFFRHDGGAPAVSRGIWVRDGGAWVLWATARTDTTNFNHDHNSDTDGGILTNDLHDGYSQYATVAAPGAAPTDGVRVYARADRWRGVTDDGIEHTFNWDGADNGVALTIDSIGPAVNTTIPVTSAWVDIITATFTPLARPYLFNYHCEYNGGDEDTFEIRITEDAVEIAGSVIRFTAGQATAGNAWCCPAASFFRTPTAAAHTYILQARCPFAEGGTVTANRSLLQIARF